VANLEDRNADFVELILGMYNAGRTFIGMSDRISQLQTILEMLYNRGVPDEHLALYTRSYEGSDGKTKQTTSYELEGYRANARIFLSTYQMGREGLDIPRLDSGASLSPTSDGVQMIGRITRIYPNKPEPIWYIVKDINNSVLLRSYRSLVKSLKVLPHVQFIGPV